MLGQIISVIKPSQKKSNQKKNVVFIT